MKLYKKLFAFVLMLALMLTSVNMNAFSAFGQEAEAVLTGVSVTKPEPVPASGGKKAFKLKGTNLKLKNTKAKVTLKDNTEDIAEISNTLSPVRPDLNVDEVYPNFNVNLLFPANESTEDKIYVVSFSVDGGKTFYDKKTESHESGLSVAPIEITVKGNSSGQQNPGTEPEPEKKPVVDKITIATQIGEMVSLSIIGKDLTAAKFKEKVTLGDGSPVAGYNAAKWNYVRDTGFAQTILLPENNTENDINYKIYISIDGGNSYLDDKAVAVTVPKKVVGAETEIIEISEQGVNLIEKKLGKEGGDINLFVSTKEETTYDKIKAKITRIVDGSEESTDVFWQIGVKDKKSKSFKFNAHFPENTGKKTKEYKIVFNAKGSDTEFQTEPVLKVIVAGTDEGSSEDEIIIKTIRASVPGLPKEGGVSNISVIGENIDVNKLDAAITKTINGASAPVELKVDKQGGGRAASYTITFPKAESDKVEIYNISIGGKSVIVTVGGRVSGSLLNILPSKVYTNKDKTIITVYYDEEIYAVADDYKELKEGITLKAIRAGKVTDRRLTEADNVTIDGNKVIITLATPFDGEINSKLVVEERLLKNKEGFEARKINQIIDIAKPIVNSSVFTKGEVLTKEGGDVELKLIGEGFVQKVGGEDKPVNTLVKVLENNKAKTELYGIVTEGFKKKNSDEIKLTTNTEGTEQTIAFSLPANDTGKTKTYSVMVSLDGGLTYSSALGVNVLENRAKRLVASILPTEINDGKPSLSFMSITSYGTQGGGSGAVDITHTETPNGQESKKTWVTAFGANFDKKLTKIRVLDRNGIIWYPLQNEGTSDSTSNFIMVSSDGTGIFGNGNTQMLEVIGMNNILTTETFTYQVAMDGKNYDENTVVTVTVPYDGAPKNTKKEMTEEFIQNVKVSHVTKAGKALEAETVVRGYSWSKLRSFGIRDKEFANCTILGYRKNGSKELTPITGLYEELVGKLESVEFVYNETIPPTVSPSPAVPTESGTPAENPTKSNTDVKDIVKDSTLLGTTKDTVNQENTKNSTFTTSKETFRISKKLFNSLDKNDKHIKITVKNGEISLSVKELKNAAKGTSYLGIVKNSNKKDVKKLSYNKKLFKSVTVVGNKSYEVKLVVNGKVVTKTSSKTKVYLKTDKALTGNIYVINFKTSKKIKAKYDKKSKSVVFSTSELGKFVIVKQAK